MSLPIYYTTSQLVQTFGVTSRTLKRWTNPKETPFNEPMPQPVRIVRGSENRYNAQQIEDWVKNTFDKTHLVA